MVIHLMFGDKPLKGAKISILQWPKFSLLESINSQAETDQLSLALMVLPIRHRPARCRHCGLGSQVARIDLPPLQRDTLGVAPCGGRSRSRSVQ